MLRDVDSTTFWTLIDQARATSADCCDVAEKAAELLAAHPPGEIVAAQQVLWDLMADSYTNPLWAAAYLTNAGCSDDGFDYFRGWLITQGREVFEAAVADPDSLATVQEVRDGAEDYLEFECEAALSIAWDAHQAATGMKLPDDAFTIRYPELDPEWDAAFEDTAELVRRLPALAALYER